jgi:hypothetical protein
MLKQATLEFLGFCGWLIEQTAMMVDDFWPAELRDFEAQRKAVHEAIAAQETG